MSLWLLSKGMLLLLCCVVSAGVLYKNGHRSPKRDKLSNGQSQRPQRSSSTQTSLVWYLQVAVELVLSLTSKRTSLTSTYSPRTRNALKDENYA
eukprot:3189429-Amphidinium_carterae.1